MDNKEDLYDKAPFYMTYPIQNLYLAEMEYERDMERMRELYPREVQQIVRLVQQRCDELEQEGSRMYDENPDRFMMEQEACRLFERFLQENPQFRPEPMPTPMPMPRPEPMPRPMPMPMPGRPNRFPIMPPDEFRDMMPMPGMEPGRPGMPVPPAPPQPRDMEMEQSEISAQNRRDDWDRRDDWNRRGDRDRRGDWDRRDDWNRRDDRGCGNSWLCSLIGVVFNDEVYRRRCRNRRCRRWNM